MEIKFWGTGKAYAEAHGLPWRVVGFSGCKSNTCAHVSHDAGAEVVVVEFPEGEKDIEVSRIGRDIFRDAFISYVCPRHGSRERIRAEIGGRWHAGIHPEGSVGFKWPSTIQ